MIESLNVIEKIISIGLKNKMLSWGIIIMNIYQNTIMLRLQYH